MRRLLAIIELGGYPDFTPLYRELGFSVEVCVSMRKALARIKRQPPDVIVCEFNFQSDFRDRTSRLESMIALVERDRDIQTLVIMEPEHRIQFGRIRERYDFHAVLELPVTEVQMRQAFAVGAEPTIPGHGRDDQGSRPRPAASESDGVRSSPRSEKIPQLVSSRGSVS